MLKRIHSFLNEYKVVRGMISYGLIWPSASLVEQTFVENKTFKNYDWMKCARFALFGTFYMGPTLYAWFKLADVMWPKRTLKTSLCKICTESCSYDPLCITSFLFTMSLLEGKTYQEAKQEVKAKFLPTYQVGLMSWPTIQLFNFRFIPLRNQVVFVSCFSMVWTAFLAYRIGTETGHIDG